MVAVEGGARAWEVVGGGLVRGNSVSRARNGCGGGPVVDSGPGTMACGRDGGSAVLWAVACGQDGGSIVLLWAAAHEAPQSDGSARTGTRRCGEVQAAVGGKHQCRRWVGGTGGGGGWVAVAIGGRRRWVGVGRRQQGGLGFESKWVRVRHGRSRTFRYSANIRWPGSDRRKLALIYVGPDRPL
jgi:hypothetical protein